MWCCLMTEDVLLSPSGLPPNSVGRVDSGRRSCSGRERKRAQQSRAVPANFPVAGLVPLPAFLRGSEVPQHPVGPVGAETLEQPAERFLSFLNLIQKISHWKSKYLNSPLLFVYLKEANLMEFLTSIWNVPGVFHAGINLLTALCEKGVHLGSSDPAHMVMNLDPVQQTPFRILLFLIEIFKKRLVCLSLCSGQSAATSPGWKQIWPYQLSAHTHTHSILK